MSAAGDIETHDNLSRKKDSALWQVSLLLRYLLLQGMLGRPLRGGGLSIRL
jgi:hypothetical protein